MISLFDYSFYHPLFNQSSTMGTNLFFSSFPILRSTIILLLLIYTLEKEVE